MQNIKMLLDDNSIVNGRTIADKNVILIYF
jgi:hypothetical protein